MGRFRNLLSRKRFPCPVCGTQCTSTKDGDKHHLNHPKPTCGVAKGDLIAAWDAYCKPEKKYPDLEIPEAWKN